MSAEDSGSTSDAGGRPWRGRSGRLLFPPAWVLGGVFFIAGWLADDWLIRAGAFGGVVFTDTPVYFGFVKNLLSGQVPYRDFLVGYPPFAWPAFLVPALLPGALRDPGAYAIAFSACMAAAGTALAALAVRASEALGNSRARTLVVAAAVAASPPLLGMLAPKFFDLWPAMLLTAAFLLHLSGRRHWSAVALGLGVAAKIFPAVVVPLLALDVWRGAGRRSFVTWGAAFAAGVFAPFVPFAVFAHGAVLEPLARQVARPLQAESLGAAILLAAHWTSGFPVAIVSGFGSQNLVGEVAGLVQQELRALAALGLVGTFSWYAWTGGDKKRLARAAALMLAVTIAAGSTLSPQYMLWLIPVAFLVPGGRGMVATVVTLAAFTLTSAYFPAGYPDLVELRSATPAFILLARDLALVLLVAVLAVPAPSRLLRLTADG